MDIAEIAKYIDSPLIMGKNQLEELKTLVDKYPYAQSFSLLYLKALSNSRSIHFEDELKKIACTITDRVVLFNLINEQENIEVKNVERESLVEEKVENIPEISLIEEVEEIIIPEDETTNNIVEEPLTVEIVAPEVDWSNIEKKEENELVSKNTEEEIDEELAPLDLEILSNAFATGMEHHIDKIIPEKVVEEVIIPKETPKAEEISGEKSFIGWLQKTNNQEETLPEVKSNKYNSLIDDFIEKSPSITKTKTDFFSPLKKAQESVDEELMPISPTLAKIFALQGNFPKAIAIYEQLILKYPEKKSFFANQITELKNKLNS